MGLWLLFVASACSQDIAWTEARIALRQPTATACRQDDAAQLTIHALGDFGPSGSHVEHIDPRAGQLSIERFPTDTRYLRFESGTSAVLAGAALALPGHSAEQTALLLPFDRSCPSPDFEARARAGAALAALEDGALLIAGGRNDDQGDPSDGAATSLAFLLPAGSEVVEQVEGGMFLRRSGASATTLGERVLVIGGGPHDRGPAQETFEIFDPITRSFVVSNAELAQGPRRDHAAAALLDQSAVLVAGGVADLGADPLATLELVSPEGAQDVGRLDRARTQPSAFVLSDGRVLIVGGVDASGALVTDVEAFDPVSTDVETIATLPTADRASSTLLVGDRLAWLGCDAGGCVLSVLQVEQDGARLSQAPLSLPRMERAHVAALRDGRLLVVGQRRLADLAEAFIVDIGTGDITSQQASRAPSHVVPLADGSLAELNASGLSLRRAQLTTPFDHPPATLLPGDPELALDMHEHWRRDGRGLVARVDGARLDVAGLVFGDFALTLDATVAEEGSVRLALEGRGTRVNIDATFAELRIGACSIARDEGPWDMERVGDRVTLHSGDRSVTCDVSLPEHVSLALVATRDSRFIATRIQRQ